eukprot:CAMPEP_0202826506 /NCGR_PEP_ID=MMETSP1389-20130828/13657_1 /ASSEMBLY_ACC=CAM_ASM_000865 /TAXON_ID=302021 /ORGANISM="Rhodomonas sp., Strain CCMP768" /LENGTH=415 /DNA_ID=CAMNT_0049499807 /DNA_START=21 /DNA_END=1265 /DNA_ORIENTATION=+
MATVKLSKKLGKAFLSFEIIIQSTPMMTVIQDIPIAMMSVEEQQVLLEPDIGEPSVRLIAPPLKSLSNVIDRLKGLHDRVCIRANMAGELEVGVETEFVFMNNFWKDLEAPALDGQPAPLKDPSQKASVVVDGAVLGKVLSSYQLRPTATILCMVDRMGQKILLWHLFLGEDTVITTSLSWSNRAPAAENSVVAQDFLNPDSMKTMKCSMLNLSGPRDGRGDLVLLELVALCLKQLLKLLEVSHLHLEFVHLALDHLPNQPLDLLLLRQRHRPGLEGGGRERRAVLRLLPQVLGTLSALLLRLRLPALLPALHGRSPCPRQHLERGIGCLVGEVWRDGLAEEGDLGHDMVAGAQLPVLISFPPRRVPLRLLLVQIPVLDRKTQEVHDALLLGLAPDLQCNLHPVLAVLFQRFQQT